MRKTRSGKIVLMIALFAWVCLVRILTGCTVEKAGQEKVRDLDFTVVCESDLPQELQKLVAEKKTAPFKMTYSNDQGLYIVVGYGEQASGGYSITVKELYLTENSIVIDTELLGPEKPEETGPGKSCPYVTVLTEKLENPVIFQ